MVYNGEKMTGRIIKGIAGLYYVQTEKGIVECKAKGIFRKEKMKPLMGDYAEIDLLDEEKLLGNITAIRQRRNLLIRPAAANIDQALVIFALLKPSPNFQVLDRFLVNMETQKLTSIICFNKADIASEKEKEAARKAYRGSGYEVLFVSGKTGEGLSKVNMRLKGKTTVLAGPSGAGKSTILNALCPRAHMETGEISAKIERGKHTTRHGELFALSGDTFLCDTPGFTSVEVGEMKKEELKSFYPEFLPYEADCRFTGCVHIKEPDCGVKNALLKGAVSRTRYENYVRIYQEVGSRRRY